MAEYTLHLILDNDVLKAQSHDHFCIAKKVAGKFTTVFQDAAVSPDRVGQKKLLKTNKFVWKDQYRVFAAVEYKIGMLVESATDFRELTFGQASLFKDSAFQPPTQAGDDEFPGGDSNKSNSFIAKAVPDSLHAAVQAFAGGKWVSVYVDPQQHNGAMNKVLTPSNEYMLFFDSTMKTESMIDHSASAKAKIFSFTAGVNTKTIRFGYGTADTPNAGEEWGFYDVVES